MEGFDEFYRGSRSSVLRAVVLVAASDAEAQDCVQEAYARAAARWGSLRREDAGGWVRRVALNLALDGHRRRSVRRRLALRVSLPSEPAEPDVAHVAVVRAVRSLPRAQQEVIVLHHLLDLPVAQVASELGRPEGTVKAQLSRARAALAGLLADPDKRPPDRSADAAARVLPDADRPGQQQHSHIDDDDDHHERRGALHHDR